MNRGSRPSISSPVGASSGFNEAPIHESGKCRSTMGQIAINYLASMRPRFMNRGSASLRGDRGPGRTASMRPRFMNRGSVSLDRTMDDMADRFNEAPIHESGK